MGHYAHYSHKNIKKHCIAEMNTLWMKYFGIKVIAGIMKIVSNEMNVIKYLKIVSQIWVIRKQGQ